MLELADIADVIADAVKEATAPLLARIDALEKRELLLPEKGEPGERGADGENGTPGADGRDGADGKDGVGLADAFEDSDGRLVLTMTDGRTKTLGMIRGKDGEPGKDGATFTLDDFEILPLGDERSFDFRFTREGVCHSFEFTFPVVLDRGTWNTEKAYTKGDAVSWAGSLWIAQKDEPGKPDTPDSGWRLAVKKGQKGRDADSTGPGK